jgi:hypothetical protein
MVISTLYKVQSTSYKKRAVRKSSPFIRKWIRLVQELIES